VRPRSGARAASAVKLGRAAFSPRLEVPGRDYVDLAEKATSNLGVATDGHEEALAGRLRIIATRGTQCDAEVYPTWAMQPQTEQMNTTIGLLRTAASTSALVRGIDAT
jgi:hypothetical protein